MKKSIAAIIILVIGASAIGLPASAYSMTQTYDEEEIMFCTNLAGEWTGMVRIEGENNTIWKGTVTFDSSSITAENMDTHEMETHEISCPSVLGALDEASKQGGFSYTVVYYPSWDSLYVTAIGDDSYAWQYWVDYEYGMVGANSYELTADDSEVLWGYLVTYPPDYESHALRIDLDKNTVKKNKEFTVSVFDEAMNPVEGAVIYIDSMTYESDENGNATINIDVVGTYDVYSEKDGYVRSDVESIEVEKSKSRITNLMEQFSQFKQLLKLPIFEKLVGLF